MEHAADIITLTCEGLPILDFRAQAYGRPVPELISATDKEPDPMPSTETEPAAMCEPVKVV